MSLFFEEFTQYLPLGGLRAFCLEGKKKIEPKALKYPLHYTVLADGYECTLC